MQQDTELTTVNILSLFETTKQQRTSFCLDVIDKLRDGEADPLKIHLQVKAMENIIEIFTDRKKYPGTAIDYQSFILDAAEKNGKKFQYQNAEFSIKEVGTVYDFSKCEDQMLNYLLQLQEDIKKQVDARKDMLKTVPTSGMVITDEETGETFKVYPPAKSSTTSVAVTLR
jgi:hypothetical protein